jgi:hypothetical protein
MQDPSSIETSDVSLREVVNQLEEVVEAAHLKTQEADSREVHDFVSPATRDRLQRLVDRMDHLRRHLSALSKINTVTEKKLLKPFGRERKLVRPDRTGTSTREAIHETVRAVHVSASDAGWQVRKIGPDRIQKTFREKNEAIQHATSIAEDEHVRIVLHDGTGKTREIESSSSEGSANA